MTRTERFYRIDKMLHERRLVPIEVFLEELDISRATFKRDMEYLRDRLHAPIVWDRFAGGYRFESASTGPAYELPGLWFTAGERELLMDILRHGSQVVVEAPNSLKKCVAEEAAKVAAYYP